MCTALSVSKATQTQPLPLAVARPILQQHTRRPLPPPLALQHRHTACTLSYLPTRSTSGGSGCWPWITSRA